VPAGVVVNKDDTEFTEEEKQRIERALAETQEKNQVFLVVRISILQSSALQNPATRIFDIIKIQPKNSNLIPFNSNIYLSIYLFKIRVPCFFFLLIKLK
jgi:hypothetical protein